MILDLVTEKSEILYKEAKDINLVTPQINIHEVAANLLETMNAYDGLGLAAPQVGIPYKIFVMGLETEEVVINPKIIEASEVHSLQKEGCLSFPNLVLNVKRPDQIKVSYINLSGEQTIKALDGLAARCFNHEYDHIFGITIKDRVSKLSLRLAEDKRKKLLTKRRRQMNV